MLNRTNFLLKTHRDGQQEQHLIAPLAITGQPYLSYPFTLGLTGLICRRLDPPHYFDYEKLAQAILSKQEVAFWYQLPKRGMRRSEWLLGRVALKDAIRQFARKEGNLELKYLDLEILPDELGKPLLSCPLLEAKGLLPKVSLSHTRGHILAVVAKGTCQIGVDFERLGYVNLEDFRTVAFTDEELKLLPPDSGELTQLAFWCAKEAVAKAVGTGLLGQPNRWLITDYSAHQQQVTITHTGQVVKVNLWFGNDEVIAICQE